MNGSLPAIPGLTWNRAGYAAMHGSLLERYRALDAFFAARAIDAGAIDRQFPSLIALDDLAPVRYLGSFPQLATLAAPIRPSRLADCVREHGTAGVVPAAAGLLDDATHLLVPAACYHVYPVFAGRRLVEAVRVTTVCNCHRRESSYAPLQRQWSFNMREIVCLGEQHVVQDFIAACRDFVSDCAAELDIAATWRIATDPFFDPIDDPKALAQVVAPTKRELCLADGTAIASLNDHRGFFGEAYGIQAGGEAARSACVAFGLERWLYALARRYGGDASAWPLPVGAGLRT